MLSVLAMENLPSVILNKFLTREKLLGKSNLFRFIWQKQISYHVILIVSDTSSYQKLKVII